MAISTRRSKNRYRYSAQSNSGFIEVNCLLTPDELRNRLLSLDGVVSVEPHRKGSKEEQGNYGDLSSVTPWFAEHQAVQRPSCSWIIRFVWGYKINRIRSHPFWAQTRLKRSVSPNDAGQAMQYAETFIKKPSRAIGRSVKKLIPRPCKRRER